ncbi:MAG: hypothetical protein U5Q03_17890 [Bacteroidota bacterium]|nr:hypothetical protein [Bacteroidota bacterium]
MPKINIAKYKRRRDVEKTKSGLAEKTIVFLNKDIKFGSGGFGDKKKVICMKTFMYCSIQALILKVLLKSCRIIFPKRKMLS